MERCLSECPYAAEFSACDDEQFEWHAYPPRYPGYTGQETRIPRQLLIRIQFEHQKAIAFLHRRLSSLEAWPESSSGSWGNLRELIRETANLVGPNAVWQILKPYRATLEPCLPLDELIPMCQKRWEELGLILEKQIA
jgi:hypothetical protein